MRIITGSARGLKLKTPKGMDIRPTGDRVKESIFNILRDKIFEAEVADVFAGTGNLGLEALSRGAEKAVFIDNSTTSLQLAKDNAALAKLSDRAEFIRADASHAIDRLASQGRYFDLIFCDPPYSRGLVEAVLKKLDVSTILKQSGTVIIEHSKSEAIPVDLKTLKLIRTERYGDTSVSFLTIDA